MLSRRARPLHLASLFVLLASTLALSACGAADATPPAGCLRAAGEAGETVWCPVCARGWVSGVETAVKADVDAALTIAVEAAAKQRGLSGEAIDRILGDVATGFARRKTCGCTACASGKPHAEHADGACEKADGESHDSDPSAGDAAPADADTTSTTPAPAPPSE